MRELDPRSSGVFKGYFFTFLVGSSYDILRFYTYLLVFDKQFSINIFIYHQNLRYETFPGVLTNMPMHLVLSHIIICCGDYWSCKYRAPFHKEFSPSGEQLEHRKLVHELYQPTDGCISISHKDCCYTKCGGITTNLTLRNHWWHITDVSKYHNAGKRTMH